MIRISPSIAAYSGIAIVLLAILAGPLISPAQFSWLRHSTSEQAGQYMPGAWAMRLGLCAYGLGTLIAAIADWGKRPWVRAALAVFGSGLIATAIWSNASILPDFPSDLDEDRLHSIASGIVGFAFAAACAARLFAPGGERRDLLAWTGLIVSVAVPLAMVEFPEFRGTLQRGMFALSFAFVAREFRQPNNADMRT